MSCCFRVGTKLLLGLTAALQLTHTHTLAEPGDRCQASQWRIASISTSVPAPLMLPLNSSHFHNVGKSTFITAHWPDYDSRY